MPLSVGGMTVVRSEDYTWYNPFDYAQKLRLPVVEAAVLDLLALSDGDVVPERQEGIEIIVPCVRPALDVGYLIRRWMRADEAHRFADFAALARAVEKTLRIVRRRRNAFYMDGTENENIAPVIHRTSTADDSIGFEERAFFDALGDRRHDKRSRERQAEQEYLLQNMIKGALFEASEIAEKYDAGIAARGTGLLAHMGIESGNPTKAQEFKNKTSKELDLWLCDEMSFGDLGAVVHYDPRIGWSSTRAESKRWTSMERRTDDNAGAWDGRLEDAWERKVVHIRGKRRRDLARLIEARKIADVTSEPQWAKLKDWFKARLVEYSEEDPQYRTPAGHYYEHVVLEGPFIHLKLRPGVHMYGDHDLFGFTKDRFGRLTLDSTRGLAEVQKALQAGASFQAQHGGIWNWQPEEAFHVEIKRKIMGAHSPPDGEPLVYILPGGVVVAAFYVPAAPEAGGDVLVSAWDRPEATKWLETTHSGKELLRRRAVRG